MVDSKSLLLHFDIIVKSLLANILRFITLVTHTLFYPMVLYFGVIHIYILLTMSSKFKKE